MQKPRWNKLRKKSGKDLKSEVNDDSIVLSKMKTKINNKKVLLLFSFFCNSSKNNKNFTILNY